MRAQKYDAIFVKRIDLIFIEDFQAALFKIFQNSFIVDERAQRKDFFFAKGISFERVFGSLHSEAHSGTKPHNGGTNKARRFIPLDFFSA